MALYRSRQALAVEVPVRGDGGMSWSRRSGGRSVRPWTR